MARVKLILEYDMGEYPDDEVPESPKDLEESFQQADVFPSDMVIIGMKVNGKVVR
jgi:hypothetical protein